MFMTKRQAQEGKKQSGGLIGEKRRTWKDVLLGNGPRFDIRLPKRGKGKSRKPPVF
jgi:hypothetical protein